MFYFDGGICVRLLRNYPAGSLATGALLSSFLPVFLRLTHKHRFSHGRVGRTLTVSKLYCLQPATPCRIQKCDQRSWRLRCVEEGGTAHRHRGDNRGV